MNEQEIAEIERERLNYALPEDKDLVVVIGASYSTASVKSADYAHVGVIEYPADSVMLPRRIGDNIFLGHRVVWCSMRMSPSWAMQVEWRTAQDWADEQYNDRFERRARRGKWKLVMSHGLPQVRMAAEVLGDAPFRLRSASNDIKKRVGGENLGVSSADFMDLDTIRMWMDRAITRGIIVRAD